MTSVTPRDARASISMERIWRSVAAELVMENSGITNYTSTPASCAGHHSLQRERDDETGRGKHGPFRKTLPRDENCVNDADAGEKPRHQVALTGGFRDHGQRDDVEPHHHRG